VGYAFMAIDYYNKISLQVFDRSADQNVVKKIILWLLTNLRLFMQQYMHRRGCTTRPDFAFTF
jgi:hypothetical protein